MKKYVDYDTWIRKQVYEHFILLKDPTFGLVVNVDVTKAYAKSKKSETSFFVTYLHACLTAINKIENFRYRIEGEKKIAIYDTIHVSCTVLRSNKTFGFSFIHYNEDFDTFHKSYSKENDRIQNTSELFPLIQQENCIYCSALPWLSFTGHKEPSSLNNQDSIPKLSFGKFFKNEDQLLMPISINVNHALVDGYHVSQFFEIFQNQLNKNT